MMIKISIPVDLLSKLVDRCRAQDIDIGELLVDLIKLGLFDLEESELHDRPPNGVWN